MILHTPTADAVFQHLDRVLDYPDCKTARQIVRIERTIYALRHERDHNPLNIRISTKGRIRRCLHRAVPAAIALGLLTCVVLYSSVAFRRSVAREETARAMQTTTAFSAPWLDGDDYYPPEAP